jgi:hypothetical protein
MPVVARARVLERGSEVLRAVNEYRRTCQELIKQYERGTLPADWRTNEHGEHCCFKNRTTGQVVEAPFDFPDQPVDPYFFALFVKTTSGLERVAELIEQNFHDGARILDIMAAEAPQSAETRHFRTSGRSPEH